MTTLVVGPTCVGKSTYIEVRELPAPIVFGFQVPDRGIPEAGVIHYNLLHAWLTGVPVEAEPIFRAILDSGRVGQAVVLVAPIEELQRRVARREHVERSVPGTYPRELWSAAVAHANLFGAYESLFECLDRAMIPSVVKIALEPTPTGYLDSDRAHVPDNLRGRLPRVSSAPWTPVALPTRSDV